MSLLFITLHNNSLQLHLQALASVAIPFAVIHTTVDVTKKITRRIGRFTKWGPSIVGLGVIPLLPMYLDEPVEQAIEWGFERYGPWAHSGEKKHD
jgi:fission process protein 1